MTTGLKANSDGSAAIQVGGSDVITLTSGGAATFLTSPTTVQAGTAAAPSITFSGDTNTGIYSPGADQVAIATGGSQRAVVDASGNLQVAGGSTNTTFTNGGQFALKRSNSSPFMSWHADDGTRIGYLQMQSAGDCGLVVNANQPLLFGTNNTERARITSGGEFLVGKTSTGVTTVGGEITAAGRIYSTLSTNNGTDTFTLYSTGAGAYRFYVLDTGRIYATNTTITAISDQRLKENIQDLDVGLDKIMALKPRKFDWKEGKGKDIKGDRGWIAQEFEQVFPDMVDTWKDEPPEGEEPYKAVNADLIPVLVKALQELKAELDATKAEVALLKGAA